MKAWKIGLVVGLVAILAAGATVAFAQGENPPDADACQHGDPFRQKFGMGDGPRGLEGPRPDMEGARGELHELLFSAFAEALDMSVEELEAQLETEKGLMGVALAQGLSEDEARSLFEEVRANAVQEALEQGLIDEEQAERMLEHPFGPGMRGPRDQRGSMRMDRRPIGRNDS
jgi:hypothetical protein